MGLNRSDPPREMIFNMVRRIQPVLILVACGLLSIEARATPLLTEEASGASDTHNQAWVFDLPLDPQIGLPRISAGSDALLASKQRDPSEAASLLDEGLGFEKQQSLQGLVRSYMNGSHAISASVNPHSLFADLLAPLPGGPAAAGVDEPEFINLSRGVDSFNPMVAEHEGITGASVKESVLASLPSIEEDPLIAMQSVTSLWGPAVTDMATRAVAALAALQPALPKNPRPEDDDGRNRDSQRPPSAVQRDKSLSIGELKPQTIFGLGFEVLTYPGTLLIVFVLIALQLVSREGGLRFLLARKKRRRRTRQAWDRLATANVAGATAPAGATESAPSPVGRRRRRRSRSRVPGDQ